jgi:hypothetical protein
MRRRPGAHRNRKLERRSAEIIRSNESCVCYGEYLLSHRRDQVAVEATYGCDRPLGIITAKQAEFIPSSGRNGRVRNDFSDVEYIGLQPKAFSFNTFFHQHGSLTAPLAAKSSPRSIVVPTAMYSLILVSVLLVSNCMHATALTYSLFANSYLL